jgi:hypothetical protein
MRAFKMLQTIINFFKSLWNKLFGHNDQTPPSSDSGVSGGSGGGRPSETNNDAV